MNFEHDLIMISDDDDCSTSSDDSTTTLNCEDLPNLLGTSEHRNPILRFPHVIEHDCHGFDNTTHPFSKLKVGDAVELTDRDGDFLRILHIIEIHATEEIFLRGWRFRRNSHVDGRMTPTKLNEVTLLVDHDLDDKRPDLKQGMITVPITLTGKKRNLKITNKAFPAHSFREHTSISSSSATARRDAKIIATSLELVCRWIYISEFNTAKDRLEYHAKKERDDRTGKPRMPRAAVIRQLRENEADPAYAIKDSVLRLGWIGKLHDGSPQYTFADGCSGAGVASSGARSAGFKIRYAVDNNLDAAETYQLNFPGVEVYTLDIGDFIDFLPEHINFNDINHLHHHVDVLHLSFPCQFFSPAHTQAGPNDEANTTASFALQELLKRIKPRIITMEQTSGLLTHHPEWFQAVLRMVTDLRYSISYSVENFAEHGLAHPRRRLLMVGACPGATLPRRIIPTFGPRSASGRTVTIAQALRPITNLTPEQRTYVTRHNPESMQRLDLPPYSVNSQLRNTLTCGGTTDYHPSGKRKFTVRESACLQSAPVGFQFPPHQPNTVVMRQIGNAFPTIVARKLFEAVIQALQAEDARIEMEIEADG